MKHKNPLTDAQVMELLSQDLDSEGREIEKQKREQRHQRIGTMAAAFDLAKDKLVAR